MTPPNPRPTEQKTALSCDLVGSDVVGCDLVGSDIVDWDLIVSKFGEMILRSAYRVLRDIGEAEDVTQEVLLESYHIVERESRFPDPALLRRMATLRGIDRLRKRANRTTFEFTDAIAPSASPERAVAEMEQLEILQTAIASLPDRDAACFALRYIEGQSNQQIASELQITTSSVSTSLSRARRKLQMSQLVTSSLGEE